MKIAQVAPLFESVPPRLYGGTERVVSFLTEELVRAGHDVTLFASGDSVTTAQLDATRKRSIRLDAEGQNDKQDHAVAHLLHIERVFQRAREFDLIHFHVDYLHFPVCRRLSLPHLTTLHGRLDLPELQTLFFEYNDMPLVSISNAQRRSLPWARWMGTVYHGLPSDLLGFHGKPGSYFAFLGRISPEKGLDEAIGIAKRAGRKIKIAAKVDVMNKLYFEDVVKPLLNDSDVEFVGEIRDAEKEDFLGNAAALLFPIRWPEPFGLVLIESLACGTPVIAYGRGSVPELIRSGVSGYVVNNATEAVAAAKKIMEIDRWRCRDEFERRFSAERMMRQYVELYKQILRSPAVV